MFNCEFWKDFCKLRTEKNIYLLINQNKYSLLKEHFREVPSSKMQWHEGWWNWGSTNYDMTVYFLLACNNWCTELHQPIFSCSLCLTGTISLQVFTNWWPFGLFYFITHYRHSKTFLVNEPPASYLSSAALVLSYLSAQFPSFVYRSMVFFFPFDYSWRLTTSLGVHYHQLVGYLVLRDAQLAL